MSKVIHIDYLYESIVFLGQQMKTCRYYDKLSPDLMHSMSACDCSYLHMEKVKPQPIGRIVECPSSSPNVLITKGILAYRQTLYSYLRPPLSTMNVCT